ncbi:uncharacterized protein LOC132629772 [Lycium barbarum]|uniref:uncharacterized protein LOC132629772 n=1 Tax=Lycium barbarum TaxID=112863 RepID=UPI00293EE3B5|nr:uncharacterized protein LOC132629772 [Lycium barbarum]
METQKRTQRHEAWTSTNKNRYHDAQINSGKNKQHEAKDYLQDKEKQLPNRKYIDKRREKRQRKKAIQMEQDTLNKNKKMEQEESQQIVPTQEKFEEGKVLIDQILQDEHKVPNHTPIECAKDTNTSQQLKGSETQQVQNTQDEQNIHKEPNIINATNNIPEASSSDGEDGVPDSDYEIGDDLDEEEESEDASDTLDEDYESLEEGPFDGDEVAKRIVETFNGQHSNDPTIFQAFADISDRENLSPRGSNVPRRGIGNYRGRGGRNAPSSSIQHNTKTKYRRRLGYNFAYANCNNMIWIFTDEDVECQVYSDTEQQLSCFIKIGDDTISITTIYAKCKASLRESLWEDLSLIASSQNLEWMVLGDFNCITDQTEKIGGNPHKMEKSLPLLECIGDCDLYDLGFIGSAFTWCNYRVPENRIWKRLDRAMSNQKWLTTFPETSVTHLVRSGSDHAPLLIHAKACNISHIKYFKFLNFWVDKPHFQDIVKQVWQIVVQGSQVWRFHMKLKNTSKKLSWWSRNIIGDIFELTKTMEKRVADLEDVCLQDNSTTNMVNLNEANALLIRHYKTEEAFWRQKAGIKWHAEGDLNTKFFHFVITSRRQRLSLKKIKNGEGNWIEGDRIAQEAISYFENIFTEDNNNNDFSKLSCLPKIVSMEDNEMLCSIPTMQELKDTVFSMDPGSAPGPDGMTVKSPQAFSDLRPISLSNFSCKILSKLINGRLTSIMDKIISQNQSGFMKGRSISENITLTQEMVHNMNKAEPNDNVVMKLDMAKAYDRVSWTYMCHVLKQLGFSDSWVGLIHRIISNNWYSININGTRHGFFKSTRGLKHLSNDSFVPFTCKSNGPSITHLCYADDTILFSSGDCNSITMMMDKLSEYEKISGQLVNKRIWKKITYFNDLVAKVSNRITRCHNRTLSAGGKAVLIKSVLASIPLHTLSVIQPPKTCIKQIEMCVANFFWGDSDGKKKYHWMAWKKLCYPTCEGGDGFRGIQSFCDAFAAKNWWSIRTKSSLLNQFMEAKYCIRSHPVDKKFASGDSHVWKRLTDIRARCEQHILWKVGQGNLSFWWDNWTRLGPIAYLLPTEYRAKRVRVSEFIYDGKWNTLTLSSLLSDHIWQHIAKISIEPDKDDYPVWLPDPSGRFTYKSAWDLLRPSRNHTLSAAKTWHCKLPFKVSFFMLRLLHSRLPTDEKIVKFGVNGPSRCCCCKTFKLETIEHLFFVIVRLPRIINQVTWLAYLIINSQIPSLNLKPIWLELWDQVETIKQAIDIKVVRWAKPNHLTMKLNTDGCCKGNPGEAAGGGIFRDSNGQLVMAFHSYFGTISNNVVECLAILKGLQWCNDHGFHDFVIESDSQMVIHMINGKYITPIVLRDQIRKIGQTMSQGRIIAQHCFREANFVADHLANMGLADRMDKFFTQVISLPHEVKALMKNDQRGFAHFRIRTKKGHYTFDND